MATISPFHSKNASLETHRDDASQMTPADSTVRSVTTTTGAVFTQAPPSSTSSATPIRESEVDPFDLLLLAIQKDQMDIIRKLLDLCPPIDLHRLNAAGLTLIGTAILSNHPDIVKILLACKVEPNQIDKYGNTALFYAIALEQTDIIETLLIHGADPNQMSKHGLTPLMYACMHEHSRPIVTKLLLRDDVDLNVRTCSQYTARGLAFLYEQIDLLQILPEDPFMDEYAARQRLAFIFGSRSVSALRADFLTSLQPANPGLSCLYIVKHLKDFLRYGALESLSLSSQSESSLIHAFEKEGACLELSRIEQEKASKDELVILNTGSNAHSIVIVFCYGYMILCNRLADSAYPTLTCFPIDSSKITKTIIQQIHACQHKKLDLAISTLYHTIPAQLSRHTDLSLNSIPLDDVAPPRQTAENCSYASSEAAFLASLLLLAMQKGNSPLLDNMDIRKEVLHKSKEFSLFVCMEELNFYLQQHLKNEIPHDPQLIQFCVEEIQKKYEEEEHWSDPIQEKFQKLQQIIQQKYPEIRWGGPTYQGPISGTIRFCVKQLSKLSGRLELFNFFRR